MTRRALPPAPAQTRQRRPGHAPIETWPRDLFQDIDPAERANEDTV